MKHWGTLRIIERRRSELGCRILTVADKPITVNLSREECEYIVKAIEAKRIMDGLGKGFTEKDFADIERDEAIASNNARERERLAIERNQRRLNP
jgi:hypothetical protein